MKTKTLEQLFLEWLEKFPEDKNNPDLEQMVTAGLIKLKCGTYIHPNCYEELLEKRGTGVELPAGK